MFFQDRVDAGKKLAEVFIKSKKNFSGFQVVGIAKGGVIVASEVAKALNLPLQAICVRSLEKEKESIVVSSLGTAVIFYKRSDKKPRLVLDASKLRYKGVLKLMGEIREKVVFYNNGFSFKHKEKIVLCDDGLVSGCSVLATIHGLRKNGVQEIVLGIPVIPPWFRGEDLEVVAWRRSNYNLPTGHYYFEFLDTLDEEVVETVKQCRQAVVAV